MFRYLLFGVLLVTFISVDLPANQSNRYIKTKFILIHGGGPNSVVSMKSFHDFLAERGVDRKRIILFHYQYRASLDEVNRVLIDSFKNVLGDGSRAVVITHSLGDFVGLRALFDSGLSENVDHYVALAGVAHGQDRRPSICRLGKCPEYAKLLSPANNNFISAVWHRHEKAMERLSHCALYSLNDKRVVAPRDSAVFSQSRVGVLTEQSHLGFIHDPVVVAKIEETCGVIFR